MSNHWSRLISLHSTQGIGPKTLRRILEWADGSLEQLEALAYMSAEELKQQFNLTDNTTATLQQSLTEDNEQHEQRTTEFYRQGIKVITCFDDAYPASLTRQLGDNAPPVLYLHGSPTALHEPGLAFSGSRHVSEEGIQHTTELVQSALQKGYTIISGHAPGVDVVAHRTALQADGITILVLPEGIMRFRLRRELRELYEQNPGQAIVLSEFPPQMSWSSGNAMRRNHTIIGLAQALCVIEAGTSGGTFQAGQTALKYKLPVLVLDYPEPPDSAAGNARLIESGAQPVPVMPHATLPDPIVRNTPAAPPSATQLPLL